MRSRRPRPGRWRPCCPRCPARTRWRVRWRQRAVARPPRCPALDCSEGGVDEDTRAEVLEAVTDAQDLPGSTPDTAADTGVEVGSRVSE